MLYNTNMGNNLKNKTSYLAQPLRIGGLTAKNRFVVQPMEAGDADDRGLFTKYTYERYDRYAHGGAGIVVVEAVTLQYETRSTKHQLLLDVNNVTNRLAWKHFFKVMKGKYPDTIFIVQLQHAGEISSDVFSRRVTVKSHERFGGELVGDEYVDNVIGQSVEAAKFLYEIGCDGVDIKFCHGYIGSQILRPYNDRDWKYGGSWEKRSQYAFSMCRQIREAIPDNKFLLGAKVSVFEGFAGGQGHAGADSTQLDLTETIKLCQGLEARGANYIIESLGHSHFSWEIMAPNNSNKEMVYAHLIAARALRDALKPSTVVIGGGLSVLREKAQTVCEDAIREGFFDAAAYGRQAFADPYMPNKYLAGELDSIKWCTCCDRCGQLLISGRNSYCEVYKK